MEQGRELLRWVMRWSVLLPLLVAVWRWRRLPAGLRPLVYYCLVWIATEIIVYVLQRQHWSVFPTIQAANCAELLLVGWAFYGAFYSAGTRWWLPRLGLLFLLFALLDAQFLEGWEQLDLYTIVVEDVGLMVLALLYFAQTLRELRYTHLEHDPMFLVSVGVFLYAVAAVLMYALRPVAMPHVNWLLLSIHFLFQTILFCLLARAFWVATRPAQPRAEHPRNA